MIKRLGEMTDEDIDLTDPDARPLSREQWAKGKPLREMFPGLFKPVKKPVALRLDSDVIEWLQAQEGPYQTRANMLLREAMERDRVKPRAKGRAVAR